MSVISPNVQRIEQVAEALGDLCKEMLFTGGSSVELYLERPSVQPIRPTKDVDCITRVITRRELKELEEALRSRGFEHAGLRGEKGPPCRFVLGDILVDFMPLDVRVMGFSNRWFKDAVAAPDTRILPSGREIKIPSLPCFIAIKLETMIDRGGADLRSSWDLEDIIVVLDSLRSTDDLIDESPAAVREFVRSTFREKLADLFFRESVESCSPGGFDQAERVLMVMEKMVK
ncbi:MAG: hypothetical protein KDD69_06110 [Bdellovibrionales bacterium]|nr:hypothetical protein [Bdellovibrionales bacterium]